tara:strand:+ start:665 stop:1273 length:609 start_codon:yes stop_codon:yes gene_type:complete
MAYGQNSGDKRFARKKYVADSLGFRTFNTSSVIGYAIWFVIIMFAYPILQLWWKLNNPFDDLKEVVEEKIEIDVKEKLVEEQTKDIVVANLRSQSELDSITLELKNLLTVEWGWADSLWGFFDVKFNGLRFYEVLSGLNVDEVLYCYKEFGVYDWVYLDSFISDDKSYNMVELFKERIRSNPIALKSDEITKIFKEANIWIK